MAETGVSFNLERIFGVGFVQEFLDVEQYLLNSEMSAPALLLVQESQTDGAGWVDIGVEEWGHKPDLWRSGGEVILEDDLSLVKTSFPGSPLLSRNSEFPNHQVQGTISVLSWIGKKSKRMIFPPTFPFLRKAGLCIPRQDIPRLRMGAGVGN